MAYSTINKSTDYFNTKLYTGNGSARSITGVGFQPDWCWFKNRSTTNGHSIFDAVRGATKNIISNSNGAESTSSNGLTAFASDGFSVGTDGDVNGNGNNIVSWNWKANGAGSANTDGSISSTVSANTTAGFSIVKWTGNGSTATIGHGLGVAPSVIIVKNYSASMNWISYWKALGANKYLEFNLGNAVGTGAEWNSTSPTSSVFSVGNTGSGNQNGANLIAYCFAEKTGYSKFGSYVGNGNADGTFVYTGFKPAFLMVKRTDTADTWIMYDNKRIGYNPNNYFLQANSNAAESSSDRFDLLSNGFKPRYDWTPINASGGTYIYMAFGQSIVGSNNIPATAR